MRAPGSMSLTCKNFDIKWLDIKYIDVKAIFC